MAEEIQKTYWFVTYSYTGNYSQIINGNTQIASDKRDFSLKKLIDQLKNKHSFVVTITFFHQIYKESFDELTK